MAALAQKVEVVRDSTAPFSTYHRVAFREAKTLKTNEPYMNKRIADVVESAVREQIEKGESASIVEADQDPDVLVGFYIGSTTDTWVDGYDAFAPYSSSPNRSLSSADVLRTPQLQVNYKGVLVIDLVDARTGKLVWRAYCSGTVTSADDAEKTIRKAVRKAAKEYPKRG